MSATEEDGQDRWAPIGASAQARRTFNPIRAIVDSLRVPSNPPKPLLRLSIGDPAVFGNLPTDPAVTAAVAEAVSSVRFDGYAASTGMQSARAAVARRASTAAFPVFPEDVVIASGCSGAIALLLPTLADPGDNILVPRPGFPLYETVCTNSGVEARFYPLLPDREWEADLEALERLVDPRTKALLVCNPSNPCGSNYSRQHLADLVRFARRRRLPIVADEIYAGMVFEGETFTPMAEVSADVPVLSLGGIAKQYLVPGWRLGWVVLHDRGALLGEIRRGLVSMSQVVLGANTLVQAALPAILEKTDPAFSRALNRTLQDQARCFADECAKVPGLRVIYPRGAMYLMVGIDLARMPGIADDRDFCQRLLDEEQVFVLPGQAFGAPGFFRVVVCPPAPVLREAAQRIGVFVARYYRPEPAAPSG